MALDAELGEDGAGCPMTILSGPRLSVVCRDDEPGAQAHED